MVRKTCFGRTEGLLTGHFLQSVVGVGALFLMEEMGILGVGTEARKNVVAQLVS